ncbi:50S ribosomal protein L11 methyltransferase [Fulvimarina sp. MAC3]|uniref:50S ribosomal protein L11 methyltransferase n=1 Tax=Fulvimarina sp. MAC3 TaxID=3148887 RepID=UPI0031FBCB9E
MTETHLNTAERVMVPAGFLREKRGFPTWHFSMMNDQSRNRAILEAIRALDLKDKTVFEIGTGAGLAAIYFASCGAKHVYTCEMDDQFYDVAVRTVAANNLSNRITVVNAASTQFIRSGEMPVTPDIIFTETLDCGVVGEGYEIVANDIAEIAGEHTVIMPSEIRQYGFMVNSEEIASLNRVIDGTDIDLCWINRFSTKSYFPIRYQLYASRTLSQVQEIRRYDYRAASPNRTTFSLKAYGSGPCHGVVSYFHANFGKSTVSNDVRDSGHWHQAFHPFPEPLHVITGHTYKFAMANDGSLSLVTD